VTRDTTRVRKLGAATSEARKAHKEPLLTQIASFVDLFVWLLVLKSFFLPLFIIPTGSMAETLAGAHATRTCPNCGYEYMIGPERTVDQWGRQHEGIARIIQCPNCRLQEYTTSARPDGVPLRLKAGDRIVVLGWPYDIGGRLGPRRWDVAVFKNPNEPDINYIKRLIGLPGETIEIIDGDIFVKGKHDDLARVACKTPQAQRSLWFSYYDHDYPPRDGAVDRIGRGRWPEYRPRWVALADQAGWVGLETRSPRFDGLGRSREQIQFVNQAGDHTQPGRILDVYGYNAFRAAYEDVTDVRLSADVIVEAGEGYVELSISKYDDFFYARLHADGRLTLERENPKTGQRDKWGETRVALGSRPLRFSLGHADYRVAVEIDGQVLLENSPEQYGVTPEKARRRSQLAIPPTVRIGAEGVRASFAHLLIERDVYYTSGNLRALGTEPGTATQGHPITLKDDAYFMLGDNSPNSQDSRAWGANELGPHLRTAYAEGAYDIGTVPADQMIGRAFLVYWPGFLPLTPRGPNVLPDLGRVRWIH